MALYGHYEKSEKAVETRAVMKPDVLGRSRLRDPTQPGVGVVAGAGEDTQGRLQQLRDQQAKEREQEEQAMAMQVGASLLRKMGWEGLAIGRSGAPAAEPLTAVKRGDREGLGCDTGFAGGALSASASAHYSSVSSSTNNSKKAVMRDKMIARFQNAS
jgi:G-patch domain